MDEPNEFDEVVRAVREHRVSQLPAEELEAMGARLDGVVADLLGRDDDSPSCG